MFWNLGAAILLAGWSLGVASLAFRRGYRRGQEAGMDATYTMLDRTHSK
ncbi:hypothetical protein [Bradyrhizobium genosp. P]